VVPPELLSTDEYKEPTLPPLSGEVVVITTAGSICRVTGADAVLPTASATTTVRGKILASVGVPARVPSEARVRPEGSVPALKLHL